MLRWKNFWFKRVLFWMNPIDCCDSCVEWCEVRLTVIAGKFTFISPISAGYSEACIGAPVQANKPLNAGE